MATLLITALATFTAVQAQLSYSATYTYNPANPTSLPQTTEQGQYGTNQCGTGSSQTSLCQNLFINGITDFCLWGPPYSNGTNATIAETERIEVAWCLKDGYGTRLFPDGTIIGAHWVQTPDYVQISGWGDFTKIGIPAGDEGGELDPHGADGNGNPIGGLVFGDSSGTMIQYHEWTNFMSDTEFCIRACFPSGSNPAGLCNHVFDVLGCEWNMPANYDEGYFESCDGDSDLPMGVYGSSTFSQGEPVTPSAHPIASSSNCVRVASLTSYSPAATTTPVTTSESVGVNGTATFTFLFTGGAAAVTTSSTSAPSKTSSTTSHASTTTSASKNAAAATNLPSLGAGLVALAVGFVAVH